MRQDDLAQLRLGLQDVQRRAREDKRFLDVGILEAAIAVLDDRGPTMPPLAVTPVPEGKRRGRKPKSGANGTPASVADVA